MKALCREHVDPVLHGVRGQILTKDAVGLAANGGITSDEGNRNTEMTGHQRIEAGLADRLSVQKQILNLFAQQRVVEDAALCSSARVIADEHRRIERLIEALNHAHRPMESFD